MSIKSRLFLVLYSILFSYDNNGIELRLDVVGQSNIVLDKINPYQQSLYSVGAVDFILDHNIPSKSRRIDFDFLNTKDTSKVVTQFVHNKGDYSFRETVIMARNRLNDSNYLTFKGHGRIYPGIYNNLGDGFLLQNFLIDYLAKTKNSLFQISKYYHKEDIVIPVSPYGNSRFNEVYGTGLIYEIYKNLHFFRLKYSNIIELNERSGFYSYNGNLYTFEFEKHFYGIQSHNLNFLYKYDIARGLKTYFLLDLKAFKKDLNEFDLSLDYQLIGVNDVFLRKLNMDCYQLGLTYNYSLNRLDNRFDISLKNFKNSYKSIYYNDESVLVGTFLYQLKYSENEKDFWKIDFVKDHNVTAALAPYSGWNSLYSNINANFFNTYTGYYMVSVNRNYSFVNLNIAVYDVKLKRYFVDQDYLSVEQGKMLEFLIELKGRDIKAEDRKKIPDMLSLSAQYNEYIEYSPLKNIFKLKGRFDYFDENLFNSYIPFAELLFSKASLNRGYNISLDSNSSIISQLDDLDISVQSIDYDYMDLKVGIKFPDFEISYVFLNLGDEYVFPENLSDITVPLHNMKYLSIKWQFND